MPIQRPYFYNYCYFKTAKYFIHINKKERDKNLICIKRFSIPAPARMTSVEKSLIQTHFQFRHLLPI